MLGLITLGMGDEVPEARSLGEVQWCTRKMYPQARLRSTALVSVTFRADRVQPRHGQSKVRGRFARGLP